MALRLLRPIVIRILSILACTILMIIFLIIDLLVISQKLNAVGFVLILASLILVFETIFGLLVWLGSCVRPRLLQITLWP